MRRFLSLAILSSGLLWGTCGAAAWFGPFQRVQESPLPDIRRLLCHPDVSLCDVKGKKRAQSLRSVVVADCQCYDARLESLVLLSKHLTVLEENANTVILLVDKDVSPQTIIINALSCDYLFLCICDAECIKNMFDELAQAFILETVHSLAGSEKLVIKEASHQRELQTQIYDHLTSFYETSASTELIVGLKNCCIRTTCVFNARKIDFYNQPPELKDFDYVKLICLCPFGNHDDIECSELGSAHYHEELAELLDLPFSAFNSSQALIDLLTQGTKLRSEGRLKNKLRTAYFDVYGLRMDDGGIDFQGLEHRGNDEWDFDGDSIVIFVDENVRSIPGTNKTNLDIFLEDLKCKNVAICAIDLDRFLHKKKRFRLKPRIEYFRFLISENKKGFLDYLRNLDEQRASANISVTLNNSTISNLYLVNVEHGEVELIGSSGLPNILSSGTVHSTKSRPS